jgi:hypothetical protein
MTAVIVVVPALVAPMAVLAHQVAVAAQVVTVAPAATLHLQPQRPQPRRLATVPRDRPSSAFVAPRQQLRLLARPKENNDAATRTSQVPQGTQRP